METRWRSDVEDYYITSSFVAERYARELCGLVNPAVNFTG